VKQKPINQGKHHSNLNAFIIHFDIHQSQALHKTIFARLNQRPFRCPHFISGIILARISKNTFFRLQSKKQQRLSASRLRPNTQARKGPNCPNSKIA